MKRAGRFLAPLLLGAWITPSHAIPITFDLAGTLRNSVDWNTVTNEQTYDLSRAGTAFTAQIVVDTDLFAPPVASSFALGDRLSFRTLEPAALTRTLSVGGEAWNLTPFANDYSIVTAVDSYGAVCDPGCRLAPDQFSLSMLSERATEIGPDGRRTLSLAFSASGGLSGEDDAAGAWFDFDEVSSLDQVLQLPLDFANLNPVTLTFQDHRFDCAERCLSSGIALTYFDVTSITRSVASVPEPGTLALLGAGLLMSAALRRRRRVATN
jgi:hypothetical protein